MENANLMVDVQRLQYKGIIFKKLEQNSLAVYSIVLIEFYSYVSLQEAHFFDNNYAPRSQAQKKHHLGK